MKKLLFASLCSLLMACESRPTFLKMLNEIPIENQRSYGEKGFGKNSYLFFNYIQNQDSIALIFDYKSNKLTSKRVYNRQTKEFQHNKFIHYQD